MVTRKRDAAFALVISWAAYGISVKQGATPAVAGAAFTVMLLTLLLVILELARRLRSYIS
jgi:Na+/serine symporter